nr:unnamed protein product [Callosobruchus chinensis]
MATGTALSWTSNLKPDWRTGDLNDMIISEEVKGWIAQFQSIGGMMACIPTGLLNDYIGRKATLMMATVPFYIGWSCMAFGRYHFFLYMGRFFCGFGSGMFNVTCPLYVGEVSPLAIRGRTLCSFFVFYSFGMLWANFFGYIFPIKLYIFACASLQLMFNSTFFFQPKSPVHSIQIGKLEETENTLRKLRGSKYDLWPELRTMQLELSREAKRKRFWDVLKEDAVRKAIYMSFSLVALKQLSGVTRAHFYTKEILGRVQWIDKYWGCCITGLMQMLFAFIPVLFVDKLGRRLHLVVSFGTMSLSAAILGVHYSLKDRGLLSADQLQRMSLTPVIALAVFLGGYSLGVASISYSFPVEIFPADIRSRFVSACVAFNYFNAFTNTGIYTAIANWYGHDVVFYVTATFAATGTLCSAFWYPETKNRSTYEIFAELEGRDVSHDIKPRRKNHLVKRQPT